MTSAIGPVPPYNNPPIEPQDYQPSQFYISTISLGFPTVVTATANMNYVIGQLVRLLIPPTFGCRQLNQQEGYVLTLPSATQVGISINSTVNVDAFTSSSALTQPQIVAVGDVNMGATNSNGLSSQSTKIPGSFINIS